MRLVSQNRWQVPKVVLPRSAWSSVKTPAVGAEEVGAGAVASVAGAGVLDAGLAASGTSGVPLKAHAAVKTASAKPGAAAPLA